MNDNNLTNMNQDNFESDATTQPVCEHADQLVTYLYDEMPEREAASFTKHLDSCVTCSQEALAFGEARVQVGLLKQTMPDFRVSRSNDFLERLNFLALPEVTAHVGTTSHAGDVRRSARAALREFLSLTPRPIQAAGAAAAIAICVLASFAVFNAEVRWQNGDFAFRTGMTRETTTHATASATDSAVVEQLVAERLALELSRRAAPKPDNADFASTVNEVDTGAPVASRAVSPAPKPSNIEATLNPRTTRITRRAKPNGSRRRNRDIQPDEAELPRLYDLLRAAE